ncbi:hypothetical protein OH809_43590 [Streptomyces sp. NBC_00873]|uniref:hypothetical protein n=1 Tax=unclassified Streptomyces TaxID=2593676 RepID=UPI003863D001|nr:hypothetical protein OH809_00120 [Streptomyces sp. NBC_00873]WSY96901.1 hypothetical protein OH809_43590 [Streptomyces sp. NBC_00873]WTA41326.1 hypothetical protein OH821_00120 [Streptomyces sp. NBC_00842]WTA48571.1 hypothetical protein OH821_43695 [Streptomyces sp. NBC_00842]
MVQLRVKVRHADTTDAAVVGYTGPRNRPRNLALVPEGESTPRLSARIGPVLSVRIGAALGEADVLGPAEAEGEPYTRLDTSLVVEVLAGAGRQGAAPSPSHGSTDLHGSTNHLGANEFCEQAFGPAIRV